MHIATRIRLLACGTLLAGLSGVYLSAARSWSPAPLPAAAAPAAPGVVLPNGRLVSPVGTRATLGDFPLGLALSPDGRLAVAIDSGQGFGLNKGFNSYCTPANQGNKPCPYANPAGYPLGGALIAGAGSPATHAPDQSLSVVDLRSGGVASVTAQPTSYDPAKIGRPGTYNYFFAGVSFSPDGTHLYASGGGNDKVYDFPVANGVVAPRPLHTIQLSSGLPSFLPFLGAGYSRGLAITPDGRTLLVTQEYSNSLYLIDTAGYAVRTLQFGLALLGGQYPAAVTVAPDSRTAYVALQGANRVAVVGLSGAPAIRRTIAVGDHPVALALSPDGTQLYVANANSDTLTIVATRSATVAATVPLHALPGEAPGSTPDAVAASPDGRRLYVALANDNAVAVLAPKTAAVAGNAAPEPSAWALAGLIPTGWYPSAVAVDRAGTTIHIVSAKGLGGGPITSTFSYDGNNMPGLLQSVPAPDASALGAGTATVQANLRYVDAASIPRGAHSPIPATPGGPTPIQHVLLIVRENRTFDQVLGDLGPDQGRTPAQVDGQPSNTIFGRMVTPNAHALAGDPLPSTSDPAFATADAFYSDGEASIQGHYWTSSAFSSDYVEKSWRQYYSPRHRLQDPISSLAEPRSCSIFQAALARQRATGGRFTFRDYGEVTGLANPALIASALQVPGNASPGVPERCTAIPDANVSFVAGSNFNLDADNRVGAKAFLADVGLGANGAATTKTLPSFTYLLLSGDHTGGLSFKDTPRARVSQNDAAVGTIMQAISHSPYWSSTAIFVMEDDSQDGLDHRDGHRNLLYVISPYAKHIGPDGKPGYISHVHLDQASVLATIDRICGFPAISAYDQLAAPLYDLFQNKDTIAALSPSDLAPFTVQPAPSFVDETSASYLQHHTAQAAAAAAESRSLALGAPDVAGPQLETINWQLAHPGARLPAPLVRSMSAWRPYAFRSTDRDGTP